MTEKQKKLYRKIDKILWKDWHPIELNDIDEFRDEYQGYTPHIFTLTIKGADKIKISKYLMKLKQ